jgi:hypothetical protein
MSDIMGMGGMDPETALAMDMMMGAPMPPSGGGADAPCTICGAIVPIDSGAPVEGSPAAMGGMGEMGAAVPPMDGGMAPPPMM